MNPTYAPQRAPRAIPGTGIAARKSGPHDEDMAARCDPLRAHPAAVPEPTVLHVVAP